MLEMILGIFKGSQFMHLSSAFSDLAPILHSLEENFTKDDKDAKNALIDTLVQILQSHKD